MIKQCLQIISEKGLEGTTYAGLLEHLCYNNVWGPNVNCLAFKTRLWSVLVKSEKLLFYDVPDNMAPVDVKIYEKPQFVVDDVNLRGYCRDYHERKVINDKELGSYEEVVSRYPMLHLVACQQLRDDNFVKDTNMFLISEINSTQYAVYEYFRSVGNRGTTSRQLTEAFKTKPAAIVFYLEFLEKVSAIKLGLVSIKKGKRNRGLLHHNENFFLHKQHQASIECMLLIINKMLIRLVLDTKLTSAELQRVFNDSISSLTLVDAVDESFKLAQYFLLQILILSTDDGGCNYKVASVVDGGLKIEYKDTYSEAPPTIENHYADKILIDEPLELQILREIERRGKVGLSAVDGPAYFGINRLLFRALVKTLLAEKKIGRVSISAAKTSMFNYVSKKFLTPGTVSISAVSDDEVENEEDRVRKIDYSNLTHLPKNVQRLEILLDIFERLNILTRAETWKHLRSEGNKIGLDNPDSKTIIRLLNTLVNQGKLMHLTVKGSNDNSSLIELYHISKCDTEELKQKVKMFTNQLDADPQCVESQKAAAHAFVGSLKSFPDPISEEMYSKADYTTHGMFYGPKSVLIQQLHLMLSVLTYRWDIPVLIPTPLKHLCSWWQYVLSISPPDIQKDGSFELLDIIYYLPLQFVIGYLLKGRVYKGFDDIMNDEKYKTCSVGQLPLNLKISLSTHIVNVVNASARVIELLVLMGLAELRSQFDYTIKGYLDFKFILKRRVLLLNTADAPIHNKKFRGYNLRRIDPSRRILVYDVFEMKSFIDYWDNTKDICLRSRIKDKMSIFAELTKSIKPLHDVLIDNGIPIDQDEDFYDSRGTSERLDSIYTELGPSGYHLGMMFHNRLAWVDRVDLKTGKIKGVRADLMLTNAKRTRQKSEEESCESSESDDYVTSERPKRSYNHRFTAPGRKVPPIKLKLPTKMVQKNKKRRLSMGAKRNVKRMRTKYRDDFDKKVRASKLQERVRYSPAEDEMLVRFTICSSVCNVAWNSHSMRDILHKMYPEASSDKTADSVKKRNALLSKRSDVISRSTDLKSKCMVYRDINFPNGATLNQLLETADEWTSSNFCVRSILPASYTQFRDKFNFQISGLEKTDMLFIFNSESYRNRRIDNFAHHNIHCVWNDETISEESKQLYQLIQISVCTENSEFLTQEVSYKILQERPLHHVENIYNYMNQHNIIKRQKKIMVDGKIRRQRVATSNEILFCIYHNPFPEDIVSEKLEFTDLHEVRYHKLTAKDVYSISDKLCDANVDVIVSGAIDPFIEKDEFVSLLGSRKKENEVYERVHKKKNTFFSGVSSVDDGKRIGLQLTEKQIMGRKDYKVHIPAADDKESGFDYVLGLTETMNALPLKIFLSSEKCAKSLGWKRINMETGKSEEIDHTVICKGIPTELTAFELQNSSFQNLNLPMGEAGQIQVFMGYCTTQSLSTFIKPGEAILKTIFSSKEEGIMQVKVFPTISTDHDISQCNVDEIIDICVNLELVLKVGFTDMLIVGKHYSIPWLITLQSGSLTKGEPQEQKTSVDCLETNFEKFFPLSIKPWRTMNSEYNIGFIKKITQSVVLLIYTYPGISKKIIDQRYHAFLPPRAISEMLQMLIYSGIVKRCLDAPPAPSLFSSSVPAPSFSKDINMRSCFRVSEGGIGPLKDFF